MVFEYRPRGTCSTMILLELDSSHTIQNVHFTGGCRGNLTGISRLVTGMKAEDVMKKFRGVPCGSRRTSCPDQLAQALEQALQQL